ncbi:MAG: hypothetical protein OK456_01150 [Thaumarchaeota archaeon]|nr:hypothetical protein [Nitrososphaerota archaeon]
MSSTVMWNFNLSVLNGPSVSVSSPAGLAVDAYDSINVAIANDGNPHTIQIVPVTSTDTISFLMVSSSQYDQSGTTPSQTFQYTVGSSATEITLDGPQFMMSGALVGLFPAAVTTITFTNKTANPANVSILVGRKAS